MVNVVPERMNRAVAGARHPALPQSAGLPASGMQALAGDPIADGLAQALDGLATSSQPARPQGP